jgi:hypothetical protein
MTPSFQKLEKYHVQTIEFYRKNTQNNSYAKMLVKNKNSREYRRVILKMRGYGAHAGV